MATERELCFMPAVYLLNHYRSSHVSNHEVLQVVYYLLYDVSACHDPETYCGVVGLLTTSGLIPRYPSVLDWDTYSVEGPMARTVGDAALMLSVMSGLDDRSPISYEVDSRALVNATKAPSVKGARVAWTPDLGGLMTIDDEVRTVCERAVSVFRSAGARIATACPDASGVPEIVRLTRALLIVVRHADQLSEHRALLQEGLVEHTEQGLALTSRDVARGQLLR